MMTARSPQPLPNPQEPRDPQPPANPQVPPNPQPPPNATLQSNQPVRRDQNIQVGPPPNPVNPPVNIQPNPQVQHAPPQVNQPVNIQAPQANFPHNANMTLDTTGLEGSFNQLGQCMVQILQEQIRTNDQLYEHMNTGNTTQICQVETLRELAEATNKRGYDHMFASIPIYDGTDPSQFMEWLESLEQLCRISG